MNAYNYDVFGAIRSSTGTQANEFQFTGEQVDSSTGLQYLRARYYDMGTGRFVSRDPLAALPQWRGHSFVYVENNPAAMPDPTGLCAPACTAPMAAAGPPGVIAAVAATAAVVCSLHCNDILHLSRSQGRSEDSLLKSIDSLSTNLVRHCGYPNKPNNVLREIEAFKKGIRDAYKHLGPNGKGQ